MSEMLLKNFYYGNEINDPDALMFWPRQALGQELSDEQLNRIQSNVTQFFSTKLGGNFGGSITAGDATVIAAIMEMVRPVEMIEIGVAAGFSSAFILAYAAVSGLVKDRTYLHSIDLNVELKPGQLVGNYVRENYPALLPFWDFNTRQTSATMLDKTFDIKLHGDGPVVAFVDGGHEHPWPLIDIIYLYHKLPRGSWVVMQDVQMMERWIADMVVLNFPIPPSQRGVNYVASHWPGTKKLGFKMAYNSAAICLDIPEWQFRGFIEECCRYPFETDFDRQDLLKRYSSGAR
ncbi:MAG: class I SAM-dependent methyltransferase [Acidobacteriaceae bacterium]|nr:class I SAM-dependent methyltransferase [Acidobacteriaceae bacterium]